jgi:ribosomal protein S18 acetylase RimI-like enzyme
MRENRTRIRMNTKTIFFVLLMALSSVHAMHICPKALKNCLQKTRLLCIEKDTRSQDKHVEENNGVQDYDTERDQALVSQIAFKNLHALMSDVTEKNRLKMLQTVVMPSFDTDTSLTSKVYLRDGKAVGFVNYYISKRGWLPFSYASNGYINYLAVADEYQNQGIGTALLNYALQDCQNQSIERVSLNTTGMNKKLADYYSTFGFENHGGSKYTGVDLFRKQLKPSHPLSTVENVLGDWLLPFAYFVVTYLSYEYFTDSADTQNRE